MSESKFYHFTATGLFYGVSTLAEALDAVKEGGFLWLNFYNPSREELSSLVDTIGIHPLSVEDCFDEKQVPETFTSGLEADPYDLFFHCGHRTFSFPSFQRL